MLPHRLSSLNTVCFFPTGLHLQSSNIVKGKWLAKIIAGANYHGVAEEGIAFRDIADAIGRGPNLPVVSILPDKDADHFGWFTEFAGLDCPASSARTRAQLGWQPTRAGLLSDLDQGRYFAT